MLVMVTALSSCDGWIDNAKTPNNMLTTEQITTPSMLATIRTENIKDGAMIANVKTLAGVAASAAFLTSGAMTDEVEPTAKPNFLIYKQLKSDDVKTQQRCGRHMEQAARLSCKSRKKCYKWRRN